VQALIAQLAAGAFADAVVDVCDPAAPVLALAGVAGVVRPIRLGKLEGAAEAMLDAPRGWSHPFGDGHAAERIARVAAGVVKSRTEVVAAQ